MDTVRTPFSDTVAGYVTKLDDKGYTVKTRGGQDIYVKLKGNTYAQIIRNLDEPYLDCTAQMHDLLTPGRYVFTYGTFYPEGGKLNFEAQFLIFVGRKPGRIRLREARLVGQADPLARRLLPQGPVRRRSRWTTQGLSHHDQAHRREGRRTTIGRKPTPSRAWFTASPPPTC